MRKDVKIGLGIGGVLLAVLIVYLLVPKTNDSNDLARDTAGTSGVAEDRHGGASSGGAVANGPAHVEAGTPVAADGGHNDKPAAHEPPAPAPGPVVQAPDRAAPDQPADAGNDTAATTAKPIDWEKILKSGIVPDEAKVGAMGLTPNRGPSDDPFATGGTGEPNWNGGTPAPKATTPPPAGRQTAQAPAARKGVGGEHVVNQGENLSSIALAAYGDPRLYKEILKANPGLDERKLRPGMSIKLPDPSTFAKAQPQQAAQKQEKALDPKTQYEVQQNDSLYKISVKLYGKGSKVQALFDANHDRIDDSARLKPGTILKLPEPPTATAQAAR